MYSHPNCRERTEMSFCTALHCTVTVAQVTQDAALFVSIQCILDLSFVKLPDLLLLPPHIKT